MKLADIHQDNSVAFGRLVGFLIEKNSTHNLTGIKNPVDIQTKHIEDSLVLSVYIKTNHNGADKLCDVGTGAGFPALVLAIANKDLSVYAIDSVGKKIDFIKSAIDLLSINNLFPVCCRVEDYAKQVGCFFDIIVARSLAKLDVLLEYASPLLKINGHLLAMKSEGLDEELLSGLAVSELCGFEYVSSYKYILANQTRYIVSFVKVADSKIRLPRKAGLAKKYPLLKKEASNG